jgi:hypothetical protein
MRFFYADPGLHGLTGHHANVCRSVVDELAARAIPTRVLAFAGVEPPLRQSLNAFPFFRHNQYWNSHPDPVSAFHLGAQMMREDLHQTDAAPNDIVFIPWGLPAQLYGVTQWMGDIPAHRLPRVIFNFLDVPQDGHGQTAAVLRFAGSHVRDGFARRLRLGCTFAEGLASLSPVLGLKVEQLPAPQHAFSPHRRRSADGPVTIGIIGHQQSGKGIRHIPDLVRGILQSHPAANVVIHDSANDLPLDIAQALSSLSASERRIVFQKRALDLDGWANLLERIDLLLCPYSREQYRLCSSGVHNEAIANAIPSIVPSGTTLASQRALFGEGTFAFGDGEPASIIDAARTVLADFAHHANEAERGALLWSQVNGPARLVDRLLDGR